MKKGDYCVVHAGAGGTGSLLIQILKLKGLKVISTSSEKKIELAKSYGADVAIEYSNLCETVENITSGFGVKTVFDGVGNKTASDSLSVCALRGLCIYFGNASGVRKFYSPKPKKDILSNASLIRTLCSTHSPSQQ